jgi:hypothetical protein
VGVVGSAEAGLEGGDGGAEVDDGGAAGALGGAEEVGGDGVSGGAAAEGDDLIGGGEDFAEGFGFGLAEGGLAAVDPSLGDGGGFEDGGGEVVEVGEGAAEARGDEAAERGFTGAAEADEDQVHAGRPWSVTADRRGRFRWREELGLSTPTITYRTGGGWR